MQEEVSLIVLPTLLAKPENAVLLQFFVDQEGMWRDTPLLSSSSGILLEETRKIVDQRLKETMEVVNKKDKTKLPTKSFLRSVCEAFYKSVIPLDVQEILQKVASTATDNDVPTLRVHVHRSLDWIPWEIMHDKSDFLGLRFKIARLPIVSTPPDLNNCQPHPVRRIYNLLGESVLDLSHSNELLEVWRATFSDLLPDSIEERCLPDTKHKTFTWPTQDEIVEGEESDILHITCHGGMRDKNGEVYWTLNNQGTPWQHNIDRVFVESLNLRATKPLVFGNACSSASEGGLNSGLGISFFAQGAPNFVGTFAPITKNLALDFASQFYQRLLGKDKIPGLPIGKALWATKKYYRDQSELGKYDPSYLFYCLYGPPELHFQLSQ